MTNYQNLCQRKIRKIERRIELCKKHLDPTVNNAHDISRNEIRISKNSNKLLLWQLKLETITKS